MKTYTCGRICDGIRFIFEVQAFDLVEAQSMIVPIPASRVLGEFETQQKFCPKCAMETVAVAWVD